MIGTRTVDGLDAADQIEYAMWPVFRTRAAGAAAGLGVVEAVSRVHAELEHRGGTVRGCYRLGGLRADADWMLWWHAPSLADLQDAYSQLGDAVRPVAVPVWSAAAVHRPAEFNREHIPAFMRGLDPKRYLALYPFDRSYDWYVLPDTERAAMLTEHGRAAADFPDVLSNTVAAFGLGDYEWVLALEADEPYRLVDLMRRFRTTRARLHVRTETPFFTGERLTLTQLFSAAQS